MSEQEKPSKLRTAVKVPATGLNMFFSAGLGGETGKNISKALEVSGVETNPRNWERAGILTGAALPLIPQAAPYVGSYFIGDMAGSLANAYGADRHLANALELVDPLQVNNTPFWDRWTKFKDNDLAPMVLSGAQFVRDFSPIAQLPWVKDAFNDYVIDSIIEADPKKAKYPFIAKLVARESPAKQWLKDMGSALIDKDTYIQGATHMWDTLFGD
jgi:hypothetical protein